MERYQWRAHIPSQHDVDNNVVTARKTVKDSITRSDLRQDISHHGDLMNRIATPVISTTWDLLRALNHARTLYGDGHIDVIVLCIDTTLLERGSIVPCNALRHELGLDQNWLFDTESLIWQRIPESAILTRLTFRKLRNSTFSAMFPACFTMPICNQKRGLAELRSELCSAVHDEASFNPRVLVQAILEDLGFCPHDLVCDQISMILYGWRLGYSGPKDPPFLDKNVLVDHKDFIRETQYRLYCTSVRNKIASQAKQLSEASLTDADTLEETVDRILSESLEKFERWEDQRAATQDRLFENGEYDEPSAHAFLKYCRMDNQTR